MGIVAKAVKAMSTEDILAFERPGEFTAGKHVLNLNEIKMTREFKSPGNESFGEGDGETLVVLDLSEDESLHEAGLAREILNRIQKLRKKAGLVPTDIVEVFFKSLDEEETNLQEILKSQEQYIRDALGFPLLSHALLPHHRVVVAEESFHGVSKLSFTVILTLPALVFNSDALVKLYSGNNEFAHGLQTYLSSRDPHNLKAEFQQGNGEIKLELHRRSTSSERGVERTCFLDHC